MIDQPAIVRLVHEVFPNIQAIYLFGSYAEGDPWPESDVDIALLLPPETAKRAGSLYMTDLHHNLEQALKRDVDLVNLRLVSTVFQKEIIITGGRLDCQDKYAAEEFEMLVLSFYLKLNEERAAVLKEGLSSGRFYQV